MKTAVTCFILLILAAASSSANAQRRREGRFSAIRLEAKGNDVSILDLKVIYYQW
jgi:hypothetical protein